MEQEKQEEMSAWQMIVGIVAIIGVSIFIWSTFISESNSTDLAQTDDTVVAEVVDTTQPVTEPILQIATLYNVPMSDLSDQFSTPLNGVGNLIVDNDQYKLLVESKNGVSSDYVEIQLKELGTCSKAGVVRNSDKALLLAGFKPDLKGNPTNSSAGVSNGAIEYCDYPSNNFVVGTACMFSGGYYDVSVSPRIYCSN